MDSILNRTLLYIPILMTCILVNAQDIEVPYKQFSKAYEDLDAELLSKSYTESALLINLYEKQEPESFQGRKAIHQFFNNLFNSAKESGLSLKITFLVSKRKKAGSGFLDNGFYHLKVSGNNNEAYDRFGKFSIALHKESEEWKFSMDANSSATQEEFDTAFSAMQNDGN